MRPGGCGHTPGLAAGKPCCRYCPTQICPGQKFLCGSNACRRKHRNAKAKERRDNYRVQHGRAYYPPSNKAALRRRKARMKNLPVEFFTHEEIFERDRWQCQICGHRVDPDTAYPDPRSASLDHVVPVSEGGPHTRANVRLACLCCNVDRNNKGGNEQLALI